MNFERELEIAKVIATEAGALLLQFHSEAAIEMGRTRNSGEVVTIADLAADDFIYSRLAEAFPDDSVCSEHSGSNPGWSGRTWLIDALDGNQDFLVRGNDFAVSIGMAWHGKAVLGVVFNPAQKQMFTATVGRAPTLNGFPVSTQSADPLPQPRVVVPAAQWESTQKLCQDHLTLVPGASLSYALARLAAGMESGVASLTCNRTWSTCAGVALVEAAKAQAVLLDGSDIHYSPDQTTHEAGLVAATTALYTQLVNTMRHLSPEQPPRRLPSVA